MRRFGPSHGRLLHQRAHFHDDSSVGLGGRVVIHRATFDHDVSDLARPGAVLDEQARRLGGEFRERSTRPHDRHQGPPRRLDHGHPGPHDRGADGRRSAIAVTARALLRNYDPPRPVRLIGVKVAAFGDPARPRREPQPLTLIPT